MSNETRVTVTHIQKHDTEANWKLSSLKPDKGQIIIYDPDETHNYSRQKIGDGITNVNDLPFSTKQADWNQNDENAADYVKNRTHYPEVAIRVETIASYSEGSLFSGDFTTYLDLESLVGKIITFNIDGNVYQYELKRELYSDEYVIYCVGDWLGYLDGGTDEFSAELYDTGINFLLPEFDEESAPSTIPVSISCVEIPLKQLDEKYIPDTLARVNELPNIGMNTRVEGKGASAFGIESIARGNATHAEGYQVLAGSKSFKFNLEHEYTDADINEGWYYLTSVEGLSDVVTNETVVEKDVTLLDDEKQQLAGICISDDESKWDGDVFHHTIGNVTYYFHMGGEHYYWGNEEDSNRLVIQINSNNDITFYVYRVVDGNMIQDGEWTSEMIGLYIDRETLVVSHPQYSMRLKNNYDFNGQVIEVDETLNRVKVTNYKKPVVGTGTEISEVSFFILPEYPGIGTENIIGYGAHAEGYATIAHSTGAHAEGWATLAAGRYSHAEGRQTKAGYAAHAEGRETLAKGENSHAEGVWTKALGGYSHAEGFESVSSGSKSHAEGIKTESAGVGSHAEGLTTIASGASSHAEGQNTKAIGESSHAEGGFSEANAKRSHAEGTTVAGSEFQHTEGKYNIIDTANKYVHIVGNGSSTNDRSNAHTLDWEGNAWYAGDVTAKNGKLVSTKEVGYERDIHFIPYGKDQNVLFQFNTSDKTLTVKAIRFMLPRMVDISTDTVLSYDGITTNPSFLVFDHEYTDRTQCLKIVKRDELKSLKTRYSVILTFSLQNLANTANVSYKGPYSVDGVIYNKNYTDSSINTLINTATSKFEKDLASKYVEKTGDVSNTVITYDLVNKPIKANLLVPGLYETGTNILKLSQEELIDQRYFFIYDESAEFHTSSKASSLTGDLVLEYYGGPIITLEDLTNINSITFTGQLPYNDNYYGSKASYPESQNLQYLYFPYNSYEEIFDKVVDSQNNTIKYIFNDRIVDRNGQSITVTTPYTNPLTSVFSELYNRNFDVQVKVNSANWRYLSSKYYYQIIPINGILKTDTPIVDIVLGKDRNANKNSLTAWENITRIETDNGSISVYADWVKPTTDITIQLKVVR